MLRPMRVEDCKHGKKDEDNLNPGKTPIRAYVSKSDKNFIPPIEDKIYVLAPTESIVKKVKVTKTETVTIDLSEDNDWIAHFGEITSSDKKPEIKLEINVPVPGNTVRETEINILQCQIDDLEYSKNQLLEQIEINFTK